MRLHRSTWFACLFLGIAAQSAATIRITGIDGAEVTARRGPASSHVRSSIAANARRVVSNATVNVSAGSDTNAATNDYRRIQNAVNAAGPGDTIILSGTFDFTAPFASAAWALGNDNTAATDDDYSVYIPQGLNGVTLTATSLGSATIQGPGDLPNFDLEGFLYFDGGDNQNWTISNLRILDFDNAIGMWFGGGGTDAFNGTTIQNNFLRIPTDLSDTAAPTDDLQNIAIHFSFGTNQSILGNTIQLPGNSVSDSPTAASEVGMQSNTSGLAVYDGLTIANNVIHVLNAQSGSPGMIRGIWENGHGDSSNIHVANNSFLNDAPGNNPALNLQTAFRITSHSSATTLVDYDGNQVNGANIGFEWYAPADYTGNQAVVLTNNQITNANTGILIQGNGIAHIERNVITGAGSGGGIHAATGSLTGYGSNPNGVSNSVISGSGDGIWIESGAGAIAPLTNNDLGNNAVLGLRNASAANILAERNWWGQQPRGKRSCRGQRQRRLRSVAGQWNGCRRGHLRVPAIQLRHDQRHHHHVRWHRGCGHGRVAGR